MARVRRTALLALVAVAVASCGGGADNPAATVDGVTISHRDVVEELEAIRANETYVNAFEEAGLSVLGSSDDAFDAAFVATQLGVRIQFQLVANEVDRRGLDVGDCRESAAQAVEQRFAAASPEGDGAAVLAEFPEAYRDYLVEREADVLALRGDLIGESCVVEDAVADYFEAHRQDFELACASHILVGTEAEAADIVEQLRAGADFATLASERSTDTGSAQEGGALGCVTRGTAVPEFDEALFSQPVGEIGPPVSTQFGFHVIRVESRDVPELDEVRDEVAQSIAGEIQEAFGAWFREAVDTADVTWDPLESTCRHASLSIL